MNKDELSKLRDKIAKERIETQKEIDLTTTFKTIKDMGFQFRS